MWIYAIYLVLFFENLCHLWWFFPDLFANKSTSRAVNECKWFNPKKMEISRFIWVPVTTDQFFWSISYSKKTLCSFGLENTTKQYAILMWINFRGIPWMEKTRLRNSQSHRPTVASGVIFHQVCWKIPHVQMIFPQKNVSSSGIFQPRLILKKQVNVQTNHHYSLWITVIHQY